MKVSRLKKMLENIPDEAEVEAWDPDAEMYLPVTGCLVNKYENEVRLQTDDNT